jgi:phosphatidylglycerophosphatase A
MVQTSPTPKSLLPNQQSKPPRLAVWLATGCGAGYLPVMPGTYGSALGVILYLMLAAVARATQLPPWTLGIAALVVTVTSLMVVAVALRDFREHDPQVIVLDEVVGQVLALLALPLDAPNAFSYWAAVTGAFLLFRFLDAIKPYPIWKLERLPGAWGVMGDDVAAGLIAAALLAGLPRFGFGF